VCLLILNLLSYSFAHQKPPASEKGRLLQCPSRAGFVYPSGIRNHSGLANVKVKIGLQLDLSHALPADLFRRHARSPKGHSEFALSHCVAIRGTLALPTLGQFGALPHAQRAKRPTFNITSF